MEPPGKQERMISIGYISGFGVERITDKRWNTFAYSSQHQSCSVLTLPARLTFPRLFLMRSVIMRNSAFSFGDDNRNSLFLASSSGSFPRGMVPLIGRVSSNPPLLCKKRSGEEDTIVKSLRRR